MPDDSDATIMREVLGLLKNAQNDTVILQDRSACEIFLSKLGLMDSLANVDKCGVSTTLFEGHESHYLIAIRRPDHPDSDKMEYQILCAPKKQTTQEEIMAVFHYVKLFHARWD